METTIMGYVGVMGCIYIYIYMYILATFRILENPKQSHFGAIFYIYQMLGGSDEVVIICPATSYDDVVP